MAVDQHPSRKPSLPKAPPRTSTTQGTDNVLTGSHASGQPNVNYGFRHEVEVNAAHKSEMAHHFHDHHPAKAHYPGKEAPNEPPGHKMPRASRPGDEKHNDEPG